MFTSSPGFGVLLAAALRSLLSDPNRFGSLAGVLAFAGLVPRLDQIWGSSSPWTKTKCGDPQLRDPSRE